jgi:hypothetical protein
VRDHDGQALAYIYYDSEPGRRAAAKLLSKDEACERRSKSVSVGAERLCRYYASCIRWKGGYDRLQATSFVVHADPP